MSGKPGMLQSMELQRVRHDLVTEQQHPAVQQVFWLGPWLRRGLQLYATGKRGYVLCFAIEQHCWLSSVMR